MSKILLVEDDKALAEQVADALLQASYLVDVAHCGADADLFLRAASYDLLILDRNLPDTDGVEICRTVRNSNSAAVPILFVTAQAAVADKLVGFESGADDYLSKPFVLSELLARVKALLRRPVALRTNKLTFRDITLDCDTKEAFQNEKRIELRPKEFALLEFLASRPGQLFTAEALIKYVWPTEADSSPETVRTTLMRIRQKIDSPEDRPLIVTLRNIGYRLDP